jgi:DNA-binding NarL/FixJ family response regulator
VGEAVNELLESAGLSPSARRRRRAGLRTFLPSSGRSRATRAASETQDERLILYEDVVEALAACAKHGRILLVLDDLHWADSSSFGMLTYLARSPVLRQQFRVLVLYRDEEASSELATFVAHLGRQRSLDVALGNLDREEADVLGSALVAGPLSSRALTELFELTDGNPLFTTEIARYLAETERLGQLAILSTADGETHLGLPPTIEAIIEARLERLDAETLEALRCVSILGREFDFMLLQAARVLPDERLSLAIGKALRSGLLGEQRTGSRLRIAFAHPLMRAVLYRNLEPLHRSRLHRRIARALERRKASVRPAPSHLAHHFLEGRAPADRPKAFEYSVEAAREAASVFAYAEARRFWQQAFELLNDGISLKPSERAFLELEHAGVSSQAGYPDEAIGLMQAALSYYEMAGDEAAAYDVLGAIGWTLNVHGRRAEAASYLARAVPGFESGETQRKVSLLAVYGLALLGAGRLTEGRLYIDRAIEAAERLDDANVQAVAYHLAGVWHTWDTAGDPDAAPRLLDLASRLFAGLKQRWTLCRLDMDDAFCSFVLGDLERCEARLARADEAGQQLGYMSVLADVYALRSLLATHRGAFDEAERLAVRCDAALEEVGSSVYAEAMVRGRVLRALWRGDASAARKALAQHGSFLSAAVEPRLRLAEGDEGGAAAVIAELQNRIPHDGRGGVWTMFALGLVAALCDAGRAKDALPWYESLTVQRDRLMDSWLPDIELGRIAAGAERWREAFAHLTAAAERCERDGFTAFAGIAYYEHALALADRKRPGDRHRALQLVDQAINAFERTGMTAYVELGRRLRSRLARGRPPSESDFSLTAREREVLSLLTAGVSNKDIAGKLGLSARTVDRHVSNLLSKLDVESRTAAAAKAVRSDLV